MKTDRRYLRRFGFAAAVAAAALLQWQCTSKPEQPLTNLSHLDRLFQRVQVNGADVAIVRAMAQPPDYEPGPTADGRLASVEDAARAAIVYLWRAESASDTAAVAKAEGLLRFIMVMQTDAGGFVPWLDTELQPIPDGSAGEPAADIFNRTNARAVWALGEGIRILSNYRLETTEALWQTLRKIYPAVEKTLEADEPGKGGDWPSWLRDGGVASELMLGLIGARSAGDQDRLTALIEPLGNALERTQAGDRTTAPYGTFLSRPSRWTAAGNAQADALTWAGQTLHRLEWFNAGLFEARLFYPYLLREGVPAAFTVEGGRPVLEMGPQTPALVRPAVHALLIVYGVTREKRFATYAGEFVAWLLGRNPAGRALYDPGTGRAFDGLDADGQLISTASAGATVEALLTLLPAEMEPEVSEAIRSATPKR